MVRIWSKRFGLIERSKSELIKKKKKNNFISQIVDFLLDMCYNDS